MDGNCSGMTDVSDTWRDTGRDECWRPHVGTDERRGHMWNVLTTLCRYRRAVKT